ncbi:MAG: hypothetical protein AAF693_17335 [Bacteroidota bacterium]
MRYLTFITALNLIFLLYLRPQAQPNSPIPTSLEAFVGYYDVGVKPNRPFFRSRWYLRNDKLYTIYDSDQDNLFEPFENGELKPHIVLNEADLPVNRDDTTYFLVLNFHDEKLQSFKVIRARKDWPTDLYGYRNEELSKLAVDTEKELNQVEESAHFRIRHSNQDDVIVPGIIQTLESRYLVLLKDFRIDSLPVTTINIYPELETYHNAVLTPGAPSWQMGRVWDKNEIRMLSPLTAQDLTGEKMNINEIVLHEFVHSLHLNLIKEGTRVPGWFWEGLALYKGCCQWIETPFVLDYMKSKKYPSWSKIEKDRSGEIKYDLGFYILEFIDKKYGWDKILALIISNGDIESTLRIKHKQFEHEFYTYLEERYSG